MNCNCFCCFINMLKQKSNYGIQAEYKSTESTVLNNLDVVPFNTIVSEPSPYITNNNGIFTVKKKGLYEIKYWVNVDGTMTKPFVSFSIKGIKSTMPIVTGQINGFVIVSLNAGDIISLINDTGEEISLSSVENKAICHVKRVQSFRRVILLRKGNKYGRTN